MNEKGLVQIVQLGGAEGVLAGQLQLPLQPGTEEALLCTPAISGGHLFLRSDSALWRLGE